MTARALVVGSINVDVVLRVRTLPAAGETLLAASATRLAGGKGGNQACALARLGAETTLVGAVGDDADGEWSLAQLGAAGVDTTMVVRSAGTPTGLAVVLVDDAAENAIAVAPGANAAVSPPADFVGYDVAVLQLEIPPETVRATVQAAARASVPVVLNAAPVRPLPDGVLRAVDVLVVNALEFAALAGPGDPESVAPTLLATGPRAVVVTLGAAGCLVLDGVTARAIAAPRVVAVDTTGAGDCFTAALAYGIASGWPLAECAEFAVAAAALAVQALGARGGLPSADEVNRARGHATS